MTMGTVQGPQGLTATQSMVHVSQEAQAYSTGLVLAPWKWRKKHDPYIGWPDAPS